MSGVLSFLFLSLCQLLCVLIPIIENKENKGKLKFSYSKRDVAIIIISIIGFGISLFIYLTNQNADNEKANLELKFKDELRNKLAERDSLHEVKDSMLTVYYIAKVDSSYEKSLTASNAALAKYNLILVDSMNKVARNINIKAINEPQLSLEGATTSGAPIYISRKEDNVYLNFKFISSNNISYNINVDYCIINTLDLKNGQTRYKVIDCGKIYDDRKTLLPDRFSTAELKINPALLDLSNSIIFLSGQFSADNENTKLKTYLQAFKFDFKSEKWLGEVSSKYLDSLNKFLKDKHFLQ